MRRTPNRPPGRLHAGGAAGGHDHHRHPVRADGRGRRQGDGEDADEARTRNDISPTCTAAVQAFKTDFARVYIPDVLVLPPAADPTGASCPVHHRRFGRGFKRRRSANGRRIGACRPARSP